MSIAAFDVHYLQDGRASAAAVVFADFGDRVPAAEYHRVMARSAPYVPGAFYKRELPADTARFLMARSRRDMRSLYELLDKLDLEALRAQRRLTIPFVRDVLRAG